MSWLGERTPITEEDIKMAKTRDPEKLALIMEIRGQLGLLDLLIESCSGADPEDVISFVELEGMYEQMKRDALGKIEPRIITLND